MIIASASRSLYDPVGLMYSNFTSTSALDGGAMFFSLTTGVFPMASNTEREFCDCINPHEGSLF